MRIRLRAAILGGALTAAAPCAQAAGPGSPTLAFLKLSSGARPVAMADAFTAVADDVNAVSANPAGLALFGGNQVQVTHHQHFQQIVHEAVAYALDFEEAGRFGANIAYLSCCNVIRTSASAGTFSATDMAVTLAYGRQAIAPGLNAGLAATILSETIGGTSESAFTFDLGAHYRTPIQGLTVGFVAMNVGAPMHRDPLPMTAKAGAGYRMESVGMGMAPLERGGMTADHAVQFAGDISVPVDDWPRLSAGAEYVWKGVIAARGGFRAGPHLRNLGAGSGPAVGLGLRYRMLALDIGFQDYGELGPRYRFSAGLRGSPRPMRKSV